MLRATLLAATVALVAASPAHALIQLDRGIAGARLGNTKAQVKAALGSPTKQKTGSNEFGPFTEWRFAGGITVLFQGNKRVSLVRTTGLGDRTRRGVGVRSTEATLRKRHPGVSCQTFEGTRICSTKEGLPGQRVTSFFVKAGRITRVDVARVID